MLPDDKVTNIRNIQHHTLHQCNFYSILLSIEQPTFLCVILHRFFCLISFLFQDFAAL